MIRIYETPGICSSCSQSKYVSRITFTNKAEERDVYLCEYCKNELKNAISEEHENKDIEDHLFISIRNYVEDHLHLMGLDMSEEHMDQAADKLVAAIYEMAPDILSELPYKAKGGNVQ
jgi:protein-arginine kinase activator protein McsA